MDHVVQPNNAMNFTENQQGKVVLDRLRRQKEAVRFCDVIFQVNEREFHAHRNVLAACSPYFDSILKVNKVLEEYLPVTCNNAYVFQIFLDYIYSGKVVIDNTCVTELLRLANQFMITKLKDHCCEYLERNLNVTNCFSTKDQSVRCGCPSLTKTVEFFIAENIEMAIKQHEILEFPLSGVVSFLTNKVYNLSEDQKLWIAVRWVKYDVMRRETFLKQLFTKLHWEHISFDLAYDAIKHDDLFTVSKKCLLVILESLNTCGALTHHFAGVLTDLKALPEMDSGNVMELETSDSTVIEETSESNLETSGGNTNEENGINTSQDISASTNEEDIRSKIGVTDDQADDSEENLYNRLTIVEEPLKGSPGMSSTCASSDPSSDPSSTRLTKEVPVKVRSTKGKIKKTAKNFKDTRRKGRPLKKCYSDQLETTKAEDLSVTKISPELPKPVANKSEPDPGSDGEKRMHDDSGSEPEVVPKPRKKRARKEKPKCDKCFFVAASELKLQLHNDSAHKNNITYTCHVCSFSCLWNREYYRHMKTHMQGPPYKCDIGNCEHTCDRVQALLHHRTTHSQEKPFSCPHCNVKFRTKNNLAAHQRLHTGEKPFACSICGRRFATKGTMEQHSVTHSDVRPYLCDTCGFSTKYQSHLIAHKRIHTGEVFHCQFEGCSYSTPKRSQLGIHMRIHTAIREHQCKHCGRGFIEKSHLVRHERIHLNVKPFKCLECEYCSTRQDKLKSHIEKHHGANASVKVPYKPRRPRKLQPNQMNVEPSKMADSTERPYDVHDLYDIPVSGHSDKHVIAPTMSSLLELKRRQSNFVLGTHAEMMDLSGSLIRTVNNPEGMDSSGEKSSLRNQQEADGVQLISRVPMLPGKDYGSKLEVPHNPSSTSVLGTPGLPEGTVFVPNSMAAENRLPVSAHDSHTPGASLDSQIAMALNMQLVAQGAGQTIYMAGLNLEGGLDLHAAGRPLHSSTAHQRVSPVASQSHVSSPTNSMETHSTQLTTLQNAQRNSQLAQGHHGPLNLEGDGPASQQQQSNPDLTGLSAFINMF